MSSLNKAYSEWCINKGSGSTGDPRSAWRFFHPSKPHVAISTKKMRIQLTCVVRWGMWIFFLGGGVLQLRVSELVGIRGRVPAAAARAFLPSNEANQLSGDSSARRLFPAIEDGQRLILVFPIASRAQAPPIARPNMVIGSALHCPRLLSDTLQFELTERHKQNVWSVKKNKKQIQRTLVSVVEANVGRLNFPFIAVIQYRKSQWPCRKCMNKYLPH